MAEQPTRRRRRRAIELPEGSFGIGFGFMAIFGCLIFSGLWLLWNSPCSFVGTRIRNTGCFATFGSAGADVFFLDGTDKWLYGVDHFIIEEVVETEGQERTLYEHSGKVEKIRLSADQSTVVSTTLDEDEERMLWVWRRSDQALVWQMRLRSDQRLVSVSPDGSEVVLSSGEQRQVWDVGTQEPIVALDGWSVEYDPDDEFVILTSPRGVERLSRDFSESELIVTSNINLLCPKISETGYMAIGDIRSVEIFEPEFEVAEVRIPDIGQLHNCVYTFSPDGETFLVNFFTAGHSDSTIRFYDVASGSLVQEVAVPYAFPLGLDLSEDGRFLAIGGADVAYLIDLDKVE